MRFSTKSAQPVNSNFLLRALAAQKLLRKREGDADLLRENAATQAGPSLDQFSDLSITGLGCLSIHMFRFRFPAGAIVLEVVFDSVGP